jgi:TetR/AcrR family transcriptional regulator, transcriptional repressor for nem operon
MRVSKEKAAQNRQDILTAATHLFREHGIHATGVDAITREAGLTHGGLYSQFGSKEAIAVEAVRFAMARSKHLWQRAAEREPGGKAFRTIVEGYLSRAHRDDPSQGCIIAALGADIARQPRSVREAFTKELRDAFELLARLIPGDDPSRRSDDAIAAFSSLVGALILARAVNDKPLSERILQTTAKRITQQTEVRKRARRGKGIR